MKKCAAIVWCVSLVVLFTTCATGSREGGSREPAPQLYPAITAFIDFSAFSGDSPLTSHQPPQESTGPFTLDNGITGEGLRVSNIGESNAPVTIEQYSDGMAARSGNFLYFFIDNDEIKEVRTLTAAVTFFDDAPGTFSLHYVGSGNSHRPVAFPKTGSNTFVTVRVQLDHGNFDNAVQNQGAQFRIGGRTIVQRVEISTGPMVDPLRIDPPPFAPPTDLNNLIGKVTTGYQAWFDTVTWQHWGAERMMPGPGNIRVEFWPAGLEDYLANGATLHDTNFRMPDGSTGRVFHAKDAEIMLTHHQWMRDNGIDGSGIQRFYRNTTTVDTGDAPNYLTNLRDAAEATGRIFYAKYDFSGSGTNDPQTVVRRLQLDWIYNIERKGVASSPNYAQAEGKPVVMFKGMHSIASDRYVSAEAFIELIQWFRSRGYYVIGSPHENVFWGRGDRRHPRSVEMYSLLDMIMPWHAGRAMEDIFGPRNHWLAEGLEFCRSNLRSWADNRPIAYMPVFWPGFGWTNMTLNPGVPNQIPRNAGQQVWNQVQRYLEYDRNNEFAALYLAMFDEYDEATSWMKAGTDYFEIPLEQYFQTFAVDGLWLSSDYYLRVANAIAGTFKNTSIRGTAIPPLNNYSNTNSVIVEHSLGPVFWRNSFERRNGRLKFGGAEGSLSTPSPVNHLQVDVGIPAGQVLGEPQNVSVSGSFSVNRPAVEITARNDRWRPPSTTLGMVYASDDAAYSARSGESAFRLAGTRTAGTGASYRYKIADTRIRIESGMRLSYWIQTSGLGANVMVDVLLDNGAYLSASVAVQNTGSPQGGWQQRTLTLPAALNGRYITAVIAAYIDSGTAAGNFAALLDDIVITR